MEVTTQTPLQSVSVIIMEIITTPLLILADSQLVLALVLAHFEGRRRLKSIESKLQLKLNRINKIDKALLAEGRFYSDLELTEKEMERMVIEASRAEYIAHDNFKQQLGLQESSTSGTEPSSSRASQFELSYAGVISILHIS